MFTIMHISDLHRSEERPYTNSQIFSALEVDRENFQLGAPPIKLPDALIVSGDLVQGLLPGAPGYPQELEAQYEEAKTLLVDLANEFFAGDRSRIIVLPGNHDVDWTTAMAAMQECDPSTADIAGQVLARVSAPESTYRWDWKQLRLWKIANFAAYSERFAYFAKAVASFYDGVPLRFNYDPLRPWNLFELAQGKIIVAAFNSCAVNDCFSQIGYISHDTVAACHRVIQRDANPRALRIAAWHHNVAGPPNQSDYLDPATIRLLIDKGFAIGLHGHQHKSEASPHTLFASGTYEMAVFSAGSLCAGSKALPQGYNPQYNLIELDLDANPRTATVHVREMVERNIFASGRLNVLNRASHLKVQLRSPPPTRVQNVATVDDATMRAVNEVESLLARREFTAALAALVGIEATLGAYGRRLRVKILTSSEQWDTLIPLLQPPQSLEEGLCLVRALIERSRADEADHALDDAKDRLGAPPDAVGDFKHRIQALRALRQ